MNAEGIEFFLRELGCSKIRRGGGWVYSSCPLAPWKHRKARDEHPSFTVAVDLSGISGCRCHACDFKGSLLTLLWAVQGCSHRNMDELADFVRKNNGPTMASVADSIRKKRADQIARELSPPTAAEKALPAYDWNREVAGIKGVQVDWIAKLEGLDDLPLLPEDTLAKYKPCSGKVLDYLTGEGKSEYGLRRRLTPAMLAKWEVCWDESFKKIVIPVRDCKQRLVGYSQRAFDVGAKKGPKYLHAKGFRRDFYLYGENFWTPGGTGYVVEGFFDVMRLQSYGYKAGATMGTHLSEFQIEKFIRYFDNIVIVPDGDEPGYAASKTQYQQLSVRLPTRIAHTPEGYDPDDFSPAQAEYLLGAPS